jgi:site-specific recombinase XerD
MPWLAPGQEFRELGLQDTKLVVPRVAHDPEVKSAVHHLRHTTASLLKQLRVPPRDTQMILGHAHISTTMQIYTHVNEEARDSALTGLDRLLSDRS